MLDARLRFIDLATRLLSGKGAADDLARGELMDRLSHAVPASGDDPMEIAMDRLKAKSPDRFWQSAWFAFLLLAGIVALAGVIFSAGYEEMTRLKRGKSPYRSSVKMQDEWEQRLAQRVDPAKKIFLLSGTRGVQDMDVNRWLGARFEALPEDPAELEELWYELGRMPGSRTPESFLIQSKKIDPDNGLWALLTAEGTATGGGGYRSRRAAPGAPFAAPPWYAKSLTELQEALAAPRLETYRARRTAERLRLLGQPRDLAELADLTGFAQRQAVWMGNSGNVMEIWTARAQELASLNDVEGFRQWINTWDRMTMDGLRGSANRTNPHSSLYYIERCARDFQILAISLGATDVEARMVKWLHEMNALSSAVTPAKAIDMDLRIASFTGELYYHGIGAAMAEVVTMEELDPGVKTEHAVADRFAAIIMATIFAVLVIVAFFEGWRRAPHLRGMAQGLMPLFRIGDYLWIGSLGIVLPLLWYVAWIRFTPMGFRDFSVGLEDLLPFAARILGFLLFSLCMLLQTTRWRMAKRGGFIGLRPAALWPGWVVAGLAAVLVPVSGLVRYWPRADEIYYLGVCAVLGFPLLWLVWRGGAILFGPASAALPGIMTCRLLLPVLVFGSLLLLAITPYLKAEERKWMSRDTVSGPDPSGWVTSKLQARTEDYVRRTLLKGME